MGLRSVEVDSGLPSYPCLYSVYIVSPSRSPYPDSLLIGAYIAIQDLQCLGSRVDIVDKSATRHVLLYHHEHVLVYLLASGLVAEVNLRAGYELWIPGINHT